MSQKELLMPKFSFRLQSLLKLRSAARDRCRASLAEAYQAERILRQKTTQLAVELAELKGQIRKQSEPGQINIDKLLGTHRYELVLMAQQQQLAEQSKQVDEEIVRRRALLVEADKQVRVLEKLRERQQAKHDLEELRQENKLMDEIAGRTAVQKLQREMRP